MFWIDPARRLASGPRAVALASAGEQGAGSRVLGFMTIKVECVPDEVLEAVAERKGPSSAEAQVLARLRVQRSKDRQVHAFRFGNYWVTGPMPDARTELAMIEIAEEEGDL